MGCVCCSLSSFVSILLHAFERITLCTVCAMLVCCLLCTITMVLVMGIGIGFHYCTVQNSVDAMENAAKAAGAVRRSAGVEKPLLRSMNTAVKRGFAHRLGKRGLADEIMPSNNNTINDIILAGNITKLKAQNDSIIEKRLRGKTIRHKRENQDIVLSVIQNGEFRSNFSVFNETENDVTDVDDSKSLNDSVLFVDNFKVFNKTLTLV